MVLACVVYEIEQTFTNVVGGQGRATSDPVAARAWAARARAFLNTVAVY